MLWLLLILSHNMDTIHFELYLFEPEMLLPQIGIRSQLQQYYYLQKKKEFCIVSNNGLINHNKQQMD